MQLSTRGDFVPNLDRHALRNHNILGKGADVEDVQFLGSFMQGFPSTQQRAHELGGHHL